MTRSIEDAIIDIVEELGLEVVFTKSDRVIIEYPNGRRLEFQNPHEAHEFMNRHHRRG